MGLLTFDSNGIFCPRAGIYIDPWKPVDRAVITHAHSDHARWGSKYYLSHHHSIPVLRLRLGKDIVAEGMEYGEYRDINGVRISLHPAGHIPGSAQVRLEYKGEIWVVSGDYKLEHDGVSQPFEPVRCHHFITESTFGLPVYRFPVQEDVFSQVNAWWAANAAEGRTSVIAAYSLGKAQRVLQHIRGDGPVLLHGAVANVTDALRPIMTLPPAQRVSEVDRSLLRTALVIAPPSAIGSVWMRRFEPMSLGICSGWMQLRGTRRRRGADRGFVLSDHADWGHLNEAVELTGASHVYVTHGYKSAFARYLRQEKGLDAVEVETLYEGERIEETDPGDTQLNPAAA